jgi:hypothetical protein
MHRAIAERAFHHPIDQVFARYTDHARWGEWSGFGRVRLVREGSPDRNGVGAVRAFAAAPGLHEEVTLFEPPCRMEYRIARGGFPVVNHRGVVSFEPDGAITRVRWEVTFDSRIPGTGGFMARALGRLFKKILERLDRSLD